MHNSIIKVSLFTLLGTVTLLVGNPHPGWARWQDDYYQKYKEFLRTKGENSESSGYYKVGFTTGEMPDTSIGPTSPMISWLGVGKLCAITVSNTAQGGLFSPPIGWSGYNGRWPTGYFYGEGFNGDYPCGQNQYYNWGCGVWIGGLYPRINPVTQETTWVPRVVTGGYYSDLSAMSKLYATNEVIPAGQEGAGDRLFADPGTTPASYQYRWVFADTEAINPRRRKNFPDLYDRFRLDPANGDMVAIEETWSVAGDWVSEDEARTLFTFGYDGDPLGVKLIQRTYDWNYGYNDDYIYINYRIVNMNEVPIESVYVGYFMDNDIGALGIEAAEGSNDDLVGFDKELNLGYTYDSNLGEPGWKTPAGYIGCVFVETPRRPDGEQIGLTGFQTWTREGPEGRTVDDLEADWAKYAELDGRYSKTKECYDPDTARFEVFQKPQDVRHLSASGPYYRLEPGEEISFTIAIVMGMSLSELKENTLQAVKQFEMGYIGTAPPPPPHLTVTPGDQKVFLSWDNYPEDKEDIITGEKDFEGYRVYKSTTGVEGDWTLLADYDINSDSLGTPGTADSTGNVVIVKYKRGTSKLRFGAGGFYPPMLPYFSGNEYAIEFLTDDYFQVENVSKQITYKCRKQYKGGDYFAVLHADTVVEGSGDTLIFPDTTNFYDPDFSNYPHSLFHAQYHPGAFIYMDGFYVYIANGKPSPDDPPLTKYEPQKGDLFRIVTKVSTDIGPQNGLQYHYVDDEGLINGMPYYYAVTSYDKGYPGMELEPLESAKIKHLVIPRATPADEYGPSASSISHVWGVCEGEVRVEITNPEKLQSGNYEVTFYPDTGVYVPASGWNLTNITDPSNPVPVLQNKGLYVNPFTHQKYASCDTLGFHISIVGPDRNMVIPDTLIDLVEGDTTIYAGEWNNECSFNFILQGDQGVGPYTYEITFPDSGCIDVAADSIVPWCVRNKTLDEPCPTYYTGRNDNTIRILKRDYSDFGDVAIEMIPDFLHFKDPVLDTIFGVYPDSSDPPTPNDIYTIRTRKTFAGGSKGDVFRFSIRSLKEKKPAYNLERIRVVPNPYYMKAAWDTDKYHRKIMFTHLPAKCTIRIFTVSGLLIRTIKHESESGNGDEFWNMTTDENLDIMSGLYIYQVKAEDGKTKVGKFAIIR